MNSFHFKSDFDELSLSEIIPETDEKVKENTTKSTLKKRGDYKDWQENWIISDNLILNELDKKGLQLWINEKGDYVIKDLDDKDQKEHIISSSNINRTIGAELDEQVFIGAWEEKKNAVKPSEIMRLSSSDYRPNFKKRFFYIQKGNRRKYYKNIFTPTEYMNYTDKPYKEPTTILKFIMHLVNYKEDRYHYFLNWLSYYWATFKKPQTAIVLKGTQGAGKGVFANEIITPLFGKKQVSIITNDVLESKFKANKFVNKSFYIFEEISKGSAKSNKDVKNFIKQIITNGIVPMEEKRISTYDVEVTAPSLFFTNEVKFLEIEPSDRRFSVFTTGDKLDNTHFLEAGTYELLIRQIKKELPDFARYLYNYEIDINLVNKPMETAEKKAVINITNNIFQKFLIALKNRDLEFFETLLDSGNAVDKVLYNDIEEAFNKGRVQRPFITKIFNALFKKELSSRKLLEELKAIDPEFFENKNYNKKINGIPTIYLP